jgi:hypothetical protein
VPHVTNIDFDFGVKPRPRSTVLPVVVASWFPADVCVSALRHVPVVPGVMGVAPVASAYAGMTGLPASGVSVVESPWGLGGAGTPLSAGLRTMPASGTTLVRNPITRKQYAYQTRVNADGDGASGPNPEREPV